MLHMIGNAHIDPVWLWRREDGCSEVLATFRSALDRLNEFDGFIFTCACACYYEWVEQTDPDMFAEIARRVEEWRWVITGGMWIQPDLNMPSGEALTRQLLYSQRYFESRFGRRAVTGYNVDSFGQSAYLPKIYSGAGIYQYVFMRPNSKENPTAPEGTFRWASPDGSEMKVFRIPDKVGGYTCAENIAAKIGKADEVSASWGQDCMVFYGVGNHGGGPTIELLRDIDEIRKERGDIIYSSPDAFFASLDPKTELPVWNGEIQHHASGCYSTFADGKAASRRVEHALHAAEAYGTLALFLTGRAPDTQAIRRGWNDVMFCQFHDLMCGCSIESALRDELEQYGEALTCAAREQNLALQYIAHRIDTVRGHSDAVRRKSHTNHYLWGSDEIGSPVIVFNPNAHEACGNVTLHDDIARVEDCNGRPLPVQTVRAERTNGRDKYDTVVRVTVPPLGYKLLYAKKFAERETVDNTLRVNETSLSNGIAEIRFDRATGDMISYKVHGTELLGGAARTLLCDIAHCDTWAHGIFRFDKIVYTSSGAEFEILETGPVRAALRIRQSIGASSIERIYTLYSGETALDALVRTDMHDKHMMLKFEYTVSDDGAAEYAEVPGGFICRQGIGMEEPCRGWAALGRLGFANDGRGSYSREGNVIRLTAANTSAFADHYGQEQRDTYCRYMNMGEQTFNYRVCAMENGFDAAYMSRAAEELSRPLTAVHDTYHEGFLPPELSAVTMPEGLTLDCLKTAEDGNGIIARVSEIGGRAVRAAIKLPCGEAEISLGANATATYRFVNGSAEKCLSIEM